MKRLLITAAFMAAVLFPAPVHAAQAVQPKCGKLYTQADYRSYSRKVYDRATIRRPARQRLRHMRACQHSGKARTLVRRYTRKLKRERWRRVHYWEWQRSKLSSGTRAMLARLRGCETRGYAFPANYQLDGHHDGAYQYDWATWHEAGGNGYAYQASPAEQDVRTAWFFPSHRGRWACSA